MKHLLGKKWLLWSIFFIILSNCSNKTTENEDNIKLTKTEETPLTYILPSPKTVERLTSMVHVVVKDMYVWT